MLTSQSNTPFVIVEVGGSHDECLLTQIAALQKKGIVILFANQELLDRNPIFHEINIELVPTDFNGSTWNVFKQSLNVWRRIKKTKTQKVIFNTGQGANVRNISLLGLFSRIEFIGVVHTKLKFEGSFTQKIINWKIKKYLVLSEFILNDIQPKNTQRIDYFYPIRFPKFEPKDIASERRRIAIIGGVETRRKDLTGLLEFARKHTMIDFYFLGKTASHMEKVKDFLQIIQEENLVNIHWFDEFLDQQTFDNLLQSCELILPLIHPNTESAEQYFSNQIPGAMTISFAYKIPMLVHEHYSNLIDLNPASFYYKLDSFWVPPKEEVLSKKQEMKKEERYQLDFQEKRYLNFVFGEY